MNPTKPYAHGHFQSISRVSNSISKIWSEFCDLYALAMPIFLLFCKFLVIILKTVGGVAEIRTLLCYVYKDIFQSNSRVCNFSNKIWSEFCDLYAMCTSPHFKVNQAYATLAIKLSELCDFYAHAQPKLLLYCKFLIILKTIEGAVETRTLLFYVYKVIFQSKSWECKSSNENLISVLWP